MMVDEKPKLRKLEDVFTPEVLAAANESARISTEQSKGRVVRMMHGVVAAQVRDTHCFDPWWIARCKTNQHRQAAISLAREGFEVWYPAGRLVTNMPARFVGPKKRARKQAVLREDVRMPYGDYVFLRRIFGCYDVMRLFDLRGMSGLCMFGERPAYLHDFHVESLRLDEYDGKYDRMELTQGLSEKQFALAEVIQTEAAKERWSGQSRLINVLDESRRSIQFIEEFGRITRVITTDPVQ